MSFAMHGRYRTLRSHPTPHASDRVHQPKIGRAALQSLGVPYGILTISHHKKITFVLAQGKRPSKRVPKGLRLTSIIGNVGRPPETTLTLPLAQTFPARKPAIRNPKNQPASVH